MNSLLVFLMTLAILCAVAKGQHQRESDVEEMRAHFDSFKSKTGDFLGEARHEASGFFERIHAKFDAAKGDAPSAFDAAASVIKDNIASVASRFEGRVDEKSSSLCDNYNCCNLSDGDCSIENMPKDETTIVYPDASTGKTTCILGSPYAFQVIPGASDKVLFYFQGGGACWDKVSTAAGMCTTDVGPNSPSGVFDRNNAENPFKDYTIVHALYCSGDVWAGEITQPYTYKGHSVVSAGYQNALSTVNWLQAQVTAGSIAKTLDSFVVMGCSAGSIGAQLWADNLLSAFPAKSTAVVPDSYAGVFPPGAEGPLIQSFGLCETGLVDSTLLSACINGQLTIAAIVNLHISNYPNTPFAFIQSKIDAVQQSFYVAVGVTTKNTSAVITPQKFYSGVNRIFGEYNLQKNFLTFLVDGPMHCFTPMNIMYTTTNYGPYGKRHGSGDDSETAIELPKWLAQFPVPSGGSTDTACVGPVKSALALSASSEAEEDSQSYEIWTAGSLARFFKNSMTYLSNAHLPEEDDDDDTLLQGMFPKSDWAKYCAETVYPKTYEQA